MCTFRHSFDVPKSASLPACVRVPPFVLHQGTAQIAMLPVQDTCAELQRRLAHLRKIAACNAKDAAFLAQVTPLRAQSHQTYQVNSFHTLSFTCSSSTSPQQHARSSMGVHIDKTLNIVLRKQPCC